MKPISDLKASDLALALLVVVLWGANFSFIKLGLYEIDPYVMTTLRFFFSAIPLIFFLPKPKVSLTALIAYSVLFGVGLWGVVNVAIQLGLSPGLASLLIQFSAFFTVLLSAALFGEAVQPFQYAGMAIALLGLFATILLRDESATLLEIGLALVGAVCWSFCNLIVKRSKPADMLAFVVWSSLFSVPPLLVLTLAVRGFEPFADLANHVSLDVLASIVSQSYVTTVFGYWVWNSLVRSYSASRVAPLSLLVPVVAVVVSALAFDETFTASKLVAAALIVCGIGLFINANRLGALWVRHVAKRPGLAGGE